MPYVELLEKNKYIINHSICILCCVLFFFLDQIVKSSYSTSVLYIIVIMLATKYGTKNKLFFYAGLSTALIIAGHHSLSYFNTSHSTAIGNRFITILVLWIVTLFCILYINTRKMIEITENNNFSIFNASPSALAITNQEGHIELANRAFCELFCYDEKQLIGQKIEALISDKSKQKQDKKNHNEEPEKKPMAKKSDLYAHKQDGHKFPVAALHNSFQLNQAPKVIISVTDITECSEQSTRLNDFTKQLKKSNENLEQFAYVVSHDLQEPLRMVSSYTQLLANRYQNKLDEDANTFIQYAVDGAKRMQTLIQDLLRFSRLDTVVIKKDPVDANELYDSALNNLALTLNEASIQITKDELPVIYGNKDQLIQLFQNLIGNAIKFRAPERSSQIHVSAERISDRWQFCIQDNGIGIQSEYFARIFVIFKRLHHASEYAGTGIGLALCKRIIESHSGEIWVESEYGQGSFFYFTLPVSD